MLWDTTGGRAKERLEGYYREADQARLARMIRQGPTPGRTWRGPWPIAIVRRLAHAAGAI
jgi:hypothetical protein